jgi:deoxyribonuclease I
MNVNEFIHSQLNELECMENCNREDLLHELRDNQNKIKSNGYLYYDQKQDELWIEHYYCDIKMNGSTPTQLFRELHQLTTRTHKFKHPYYVSKDQYLYTWVDLYVDGKLKSIYSGEQKNPIKVIEEDYKTIQKRFELYQRYLENDRLLSKEIEQQVFNISKQYRFNAEHVVPQSWFKSKEPMKGDLHHLFACDPECNNARSNFPYFEFDPNLEVNPLHYKDHCGTYGIGHFEPEYGKGAVARASLYFLIRYPRKIMKKFRRNFNIPLLQRWHYQFPVSRYEKHRNRAIFEIQGNRNPFIDFPELIDKVDFMLGNK